MSTIDHDTDERRAQAVARLRKRSEFWTHAAGYVLVNAVLVVTWFFTGPEGFFWPIIPMAAWGIGLFFHGMDAFRQPLSEERIRREMDRLP